MLEKPDVPDETLIACLRDAFDVRATQIAFLPIGNDVDTAAYRVAAGDAAPYFLKLRSWRRGGRFAPATVAIPRFLHEHGIAPVIAPIPTCDGRLWAHLGDFAVILFPFVAGRNGFETPLSGRHWAELGAAVRAMHAVAVPPALSAQIARETYSRHRRDRVTGLLAGAEGTAGTEPAAAQMAACLREHYAVISHMVARADALGDTLRASPPASVLCHADLHAANVLLATDGALYIVDWDTPILAPKERDLMFIGGGVGGAWDTDREEALFYRGYGPTAIDPVALAYYRYERIIEDIAEYGERLPLGGASGEDWAVGFVKFRAQFGANGVVEIARRTDRALDAR